MTARPHWHGCPAGPTPRRRGRAHGAGPATGRAGGPSGAIPRAGGAQRAIRPITCRPRQFATRARQTTLGCLPLLVQHWTTRGDPDGATRAPRYTGSAAARRARLGPFPWAGERGCRATDSRPAARPRSRSIPGRIAKTLAIAAPHRGVDQPGTCPLRITGIRSAQLLLHLHTDPADDGDDVAIPRDRCWDRNAGGQTTFCRHALGLFGKWHSRNRVRNTPPGLAFTTALKIINNHIPPPHDTVCSLPTRSTICYPYSVGAAPALEAEP